MEGMRRGWGGQPGLGQAGSRAPSQPEQEALGNAEAGTGERRSRPRGLERAPSSLRRGGVVVRSWVLPLDCLRRSSGRERSLGGFFTRFPPGLFGWFLQLGALCLIQKLDLERT